MQYAICNMCDQVHEDTNPSNQPHFPEYDFPKTQTIQCGEDKDTGEKYFLVGCVYCMTDEYLSDLLEDPKNLEESVNQKTFYVQAGVGKSKYVVNFYNGVKTHKDGSDFFDIAIFSNKKELKVFTRNLINDGYMKI